MEQATKDIVRLVTRADPGGALAALTRQLSDARSIDETLAIVSHSVRTLLQADGASFVLRDGDRCYYAEEDAVSPLWKGRRFPMSACISGWCMTHRRPVVLEDIYEDPRIPADAYRPTFVRSLAMAPVGKDEPIAALGVYWAERRRPGPDEIERLEAIAEAAGRALADHQPRPAGATQGRGPRQTAPEPNKAAEPVALDPVLERGSLRAFMTRVRNKGLRPDSLESSVFAVLCVLIATLVREGFRASGAPGLGIFSVYYPVVLLAMLVGGRGCGILAAALGGLAAYYFFMPPLFEFVSPTLSDTLNLSLYGGASALIILIIDRYQRDVMRLRQEDARHLTLAREQNHRLRNAITVAEAIVQQSLRDLPDRGRTIARRIRAGLAQVEMEEAGCRPVGLREFLASELGLYDLARFSLEGPDTGQLPPKVQNTLSLVFHELATNALKHGALSVPEGRVAVTSSREDGVTKIVWLETGGPPVQAPQKRGYGSILMQRIVQNIDGSCTLDFRPTGLAAEIRLVLPKDSAAIRPVTYNS